MKVHSTPETAGLTDPRSEAFIEKFSSLLIAGGAIDELALRRAQRAQAQSNERFDLVLTRLGLLTEGEMAKSVATFLGLDQASRSDFPHVPLFAAELPLNFLKASNIIPLQDKTDVVVIATADPFNLEAPAALAYTLQRKVEIRVATVGDVEAALERLYGDGVTVSERSDLSNNGQSDVATSEDVRRLEDMASEAPIIRLVNELISDAVEQQASDIHFEPREDSVRVRFRIDGMLDTVETLPIAISRNVSSRIKVMAGLNIAERRLPQDGRIKVSVRGRDIDLRVSTMPTICGESVVLRILDRSSVALEFEKLGFSGGDLAAFRQILTEPNGIILSTGPTGSGKTTTLYTALSMLNVPAKKVFTVEDPIEYRLAGVNQIQVNSKISLTFASALRSMLRQDPDIIMVGEIRDLETAEIAIRASLTGHLVLSTIHTNSAAATLTRLLNMGIEDYLLASSLKGILSQRLVRRLCLSCAQPASLPAAMVSRLAKLRSGVTNPELADGHAIKRPAGCPECRNTGFSGRTTIYELLIMNDAIRDVLISKGTERAILNSAKSSGMTTLFEIGLNKVFNGETTLDEVLRVTRHADA